MTGCDVPGHENVWSVSLVLIFHRDIFLLVHIPMKRWELLNFLQGVMTQNITKPNSDSSLYTGRRNVFISMVQVNAM
jgi:hypothetical protein